MGSEITQFKKGQIPWNVGKKHSKESIEKMKGKREGFIPWNKGKKGVQMVSKETKLRISKSLKGRIFTDEHKKKISLALKGEKSIEWKGDNVSYRGLHKWIENQLGKPMTCSICLNSNLNKTQYHWSNISGNYKRELSDWQRLCVKCHRQFDKGRNSIINKYKQ